MTLRPLARCCSVEAYVAMLLCGAAVSLRADTGGGRGRGLVATEALAKDAHLFAERPLLLLDNQVRIIY
jgi:hypothetical protein